MNVADVVKAAEIKMDRALLAYSQSKLTRSDVHKHLIDEFRKATTEFLTLRELLHHGQELPH